MLGVNFVVHIWIQAAETVIPHVVGNVGPHGLRFNIYQIYNSRRNGAFA